MKSAKLRGSEQRIRFLIAQTSAATDGDLELQAHWGQYLCVLVAGFMENAHEEVFGKYVRQPPTSPRVGRYAATQLESVQNPKGYRFVETARAFDPAWAEQLTAYLSDQGRSDALDGIMSNRHLIVHGNATGITVARVREYFDKCVSIVEFIEALCNA